jgi:hypothetical protein
MHVGSAQLSLRMGQREMEKTGQSGTEFNSETMAAALAKLKRSP